MAAELGEFAIVQAAERGDLEEVRRLVQQDRQLLNARCYWDTPLTGAAKWGRVEVVRYLLDEGADINLRSGSLARSALEWSCANGHVEVAALLLERCADTTPSRSGWTLLLSASCGGHVGVVELLLAHGCGDLDQPDLDSGSTALHWASINGRSCVVRVLLGAGADPHVVDRYGDTPLTEAVEHKRVVCVAWLKVGICFCLYVVAAISTPTSKGVGGSNSHVL
jgi:ankyrin repeat protein